MNCVVCAMAKNEHLYINDWVKHYINLGFSHVYLFDNDDTTSPNVIDSIDDNYKDKVTIFNVRGLKEQGFQKKNYKKFYTEYNNSFDWCLFCDIDEFLFGINDINELVTSIPTKYSQIRIKWRLFGDDDIVERDTSIPVYESFTHELVGHELANQGKGMIRGGLDKVFFNSVHYGAQDEHENILPSCLPSGKVCNSKVEIEEDYSTEKVFMNHYMTKTLSEFIAQKFNRGDAIFKTRVIDLSYFWNLNNKTADKIRWLNNHGLLGQKKNGIDLVVPYVDSTDPEWVSLFTKYNNYNKTVEEINAVNRFRGQGDFFRFFFRGIAQNIPWIRTIHLIVQDSTQVPRWLNLDNVNIVYHRDFIPEEFLPTFNSTTIEMFLWNIPNLSEQFIYVNDDFFVINNVSREDLFQTDRVVTEVFNVTRLNTMYGHHIDNSYKEIFGKIETSTRTVGHNLRPYLKSEMADCFHNHEKAIKKSISRFREDKNFNVFLFTFDLMKKDKLINERRVTFSSCYLEKIPGILKYIAAKYKTVICIQDTDETQNIYDNAALYKVFKDMFPKKCKYEDPNIASDVTPDQLDKIEKIVARLPERKRAKVRDALIKSWTR